MAEPPFEPSRILEALQRHGVAFVVIGATAAIAQGYPLPTEDVNVTPARDPENLELLAEALVELGARLRLPDGTDVAFPIEPRLLAGSESWTLATTFGPLDLVFMPAGTRGYDDLRRGAIELDIGAPVHVAALIDVIRSKEAAGRPKDVAQLPALRQTLEVIRERERR